MAKMLEAIANVSMIAAAALVGATLVRDHLAPRRLSLPETPPPGTKLRLPGHEWSTRSIVLVLESRCRICTESAPFYRRLVKAAEEQGVQLVAALPQASADARGYLRGLDIAIDDVLQIAPAVIGVQGMPTLIAVDRHGLVKQVWRGRLAPAEEAAVLASLRGD